MTSTRIGVIGAGHWGPNLIRNFHDATNAEVVVVADKSAPRLEQVKQRFPGVSVTSDANDVLADDSIDAVVVATPTVTHNAIVKSALERRKHVLVEKPVTTNSQEADALAKLAEETGRVLMVGHVFLFNGAVRRVKRYLDDGDLGRLYYVSMQRTNLGPIRMDVNAAWDLASHDISITSWWIGKNATHVSCIGGNWINPGVEDAVFATLRYPDGVLVNLHASWLNPRKARDITVVGDKKMLTFDDMNMNEPIRIYDKGVTDAVTKPAFIDSMSSFRASVRMGDVTIPNVSSGEPLKNECNHFLDCIQKKVVCESDAVFGAGVVRVLEAMDRSMKNAGREEAVV